MPSPHLAREPEPLCLTRYLARPLTSRPLSHSSSPATKRNLKPTPIAASLQQHSQYPAAPELPSLQPAVSVAPAAQDTHAGAQQPLSPTNKKRKSVSLNHTLDQMASSAAGAEAQATNATAPQAAEVDVGAQEPRAKKSRTNTPWTPAEELRLKQMRDAGNSWSEIAKVDTLDVGVA